MTQKERILEHAARMFVMQGIKSVRMDDIARSMGISKRTLYEHFGDKEELLYLAVDRYFEQQRHLHEQLAAEADNVIEALFRVLGRIMDGAAQSARMLETLHKFYPAIYDRLMRTGYEKKRSSLRTMLRQGIAQGLFTDRFNTELAISVLNYTASAIVMRHDLYLPEGLTEREAFVQIISNFFRGISTARGLELVDDCLHRYELAESGTPAPTDTYEFRKANA